ncbi:hypothetical protein OY671_010245, partial [Metschnikowia pulcherrima]
MSVVMLVTMHVHDDSWMTSYFEEVPKLLAEFGATSIAGSREIRRSEGTGPVPDRAAISTFPTMEAVDRFMADPRYQAFRIRRESATSSDIFVFENAVTAGEL